MDLAKSQLLTNSSNKNNSLDLISFSGEINDTHTYFETKQIGHNDNASVSSMEAKSKSVCFQFFCGGF